MEEDLRFGIGLKGLGVWNSDKSNDNDKSGWPPIANQINNTSNKGNEIRQLPSEAAAQASQKRAKQSGEGNMDDSGEEPQQKPQPPRDTSLWDEPVSDMEYWGQGENTTVYRSNNPKDMTYSGKKQNILYNTSYLGIGPEQLTSEQNRRETKEKDNILNSSIQKSDINNTDLKILLPNYGVSDFINERALWQKGTYNTLGEQGWFYFKIFFDFTNSKLFNGLLPIYGNTTFLNNTCALRYLYGIRNAYKHDRIHDRILSLGKFTNLLSYINTVCPWFFKSISNIGKLNSLNMTEFTKEKYITIQCDSEAIDMRLSTLFDLYRNACYDDIYRKEIIPENLRKFDMQIVIMNIPLKYFHTAFLSANKTNLESALTNVAGKIGGPISKIASFISGQNSSIYDFKTLENNIGDNDFMSFQLFTLKNCEFVINDSLEGYYGNTLSNGELFNLGNNTIKIKYDNVYKHSYNEWEKIFFGSTTFDYNNDKELAQMYGDSSRSLFMERINAEYATIHIPTANIAHNFNSRIETIKTNLNNIFFSPGTDGIYKSLIDFSEKTIKDSMIGVTNPYWLGNIGDPNVISTDSTLKKYYRALGNVFNIK